MKTDMLRIVTSNKPNAMVDLNYWFSYFTHFTNSEIFVGGDNLKHLKRAIKNRNLPLVMIHAPMKLMDVFSYRPNYKLITRCNNENRS